MTFSGEHEAIQFLADKIMCQAHRESISLSDAEQHMLHWSESDPEFVLDNSLESEFNEETDEQQYFAKIRGLFRRAYIVDRRTHNPDRTRYADALQSLDSSDYYLASELRGALPSSMYQAVLYGCVWSLLGSAGLFLLLLSPK